MFGRKSLPGSLFGGEPFRDPFQQADAMMRSFFGEDPFNRAQQQQQQGANRQPQQQQQQRRQGRPASTGRTIPIEGPDEQPHPYFAEAPPSGPGSQQQAGRLGSGGPLIAELDDASHQEHLLFGSSQPDTVEEPEEEEREAREAGGGEGSQRTAGVEGTAPWYNGQREGPEPAQRASHGGGSYHRVVVRHGGRGGMRVTRMQTTRTGPGGVMERWEEVRDSTTGHESVMLTRKLGDKGRTEHSVRDSEGRLRTEGYLHNLEEGEAAQFEQDWAQHAQRGLPPGAQHAQQAQPASGAPALQGSWGSDSPSSGQPLIEEYESEGDEEGPHAQGATSSGLPAASDEEARWGPLEGQPGTVAPPAAGAAAQPQLMPELEESEEGGRGGRGTSGRAGVAWGRGQGNGADGRSRGVKRSRAGLAHEAGQPGSSGSGGGGTGGGGTGGTRGTGGGSAGGGGDGEAPMDLDGGAGSAQLLSIEPEPAGAAGAEAAEAAGGGAAGLEQAGAAAAGAEAAAIGPPWWFEDEEGVVHIDEDDEEQLPAAGEAGGEVAVEPAAGG